ncbi:MAG: hypothetical protein EOP06_12235 [Proteobacteria bacterium]|nr:MAG: hypothetical protein EOP06_12235 [Pseudomonadota bacterium]
MPDNTEVVPEISICIAETSDAPKPGSWEKDFTENVAAFFQKFPVRYELLFPEQHVFSTRAARLERTVARARAPLIIVMEADLRVPLSECFKLLESFFSDPEMQFVAGDRLHKQKKLRDDQAAEMETPTEKFFTGIIREKRRWLFKDPFCGMIAFRKSTFEQMRPHMHSFGWHWTPELQRVAQKLSLKYLEVPIYSAARPSHWKSSLSEKLGLLLFILFRI